MSRLCAGCDYGRPSPVSLCSLRDSPGAGRLLASAALLCMAPAPGTDYPRPSDRQNSRGLHSSASSRPTCSRTRQCWLQLCVSCTVVRRCCDCTASSAPTTNVQTQLNSRHWGTGQINVRHGSTSSGPVLPPCESL